MKKFLSLFILSLALAVQAAGQKADRQSELNSVVEAERAFARMSVEKGTRAAFIENLADDSILFRPGPVAGKKWMEERPAQKGILTWRPAFADVSAAGDMGYTTGPWEFREKSLEEKPVAYGDFITIWKKQPDGKWKAFLDMGSQHAEPAVSTAEVQFPSLKWSKGKSKVDAAAERGALLDAENSFLKLHGEKNSIDSFLSFLADDVRLYRRNIFPALGKAAARSALEANFGTLSWHTTGGGVAASGDLGYTYGAYELKGGEGKATESGNYLRIWRRQKDGKWRIVLDNLSPVPRAN